MNYYGPKELAESFRTVRKNTLIIANEIPEDKYGFKPTPESRSIAQTMAHIALTGRMQMQVHGVDKRKTLEGFDFPTFFGGLMAEEQTPRTKAQLITFLTEEGDKFSKWVAGLPDDFLGERISMPPGGTPESRTRFDMIMSVKEHEMHHRGQLMLIERMIGIVPHLTRDMQARMASMMANTASAKPA